VTNNISQRQRVEGPSSVTKAVRLIEALASADGTVGVTELARQVDVDKGSVSRILHTLEAAGFVTQDPATKCYALGLTFVHLSEKALRTVTLRQAARNSLERLAKRTGESAHLGVLVQGSVLYIDQAAPTRGAWIDVPIGTLAPSHCTALGKSLLAFQPDEVQSALRMALDLQPFTRRTLTSVDALSLHLEQVRNSGLSFDDEEFSVGVRCIAIPILGRDGHVAATIGLSGPSPRMTDEQLSIWGTLIRQEANVISAVIGGPVENEDPVPAREIIAG